MESENRPTHIRPVIAQIDTDLLSNETESFHHLILRPILKMQNDLLLAIFRQYLLQQKVQMERWETVQRIAFITKAIQKDLALKNTLLGMVLGQLTPEELPRYFSAEQELKKRIFQMLTKRLSTQAHLF